ncbi:NAD-dependent DNA ligase LigA [Clostridium sp. BJN0013]|uniref:NAD-dependent DNA ligase LigA n=1 Tax=Clostridium sp. BJN0013 TaxID=3236840 RepID=UPI0034C6A0A9
MDIKNKIEELSKLIEYHNDRYYNKDEPEITDYEYDKLSLELRKLEKEYPEYARKDSPTQKVGGTTKRELKKVNHDIPVMSLQDVFSKEEVYSFIYKISSELHNPAFVVEKKIDGLSVVLRYYNGEFKEGITRGDGIIGESVYENLLQIETIPKTIPERLPYLEVRGEVYMSNDSFIKINEMQKQQGGRKYQTARNLAAGTLRQLDPTIVKHRNLDIFIFNLETVQGKQFSYHSESLSWLLAQGFKVSPDFALCKTAEGVWNSICEIQDKRWKLPFQIDGAVVKVDSLEDRKSLGSTSKTPKWAIAYKYPPEQKETVVEDIIVQIGRTGRLTPLAILSPVKLAGTTVSKATLHNQDFIDSKDIQIGDTVIIQKAGDIIPEVIKSIPEKRPENSKRYIIPDKCPICGSETLREPEGSDIRCSNSNCYAQVVRSIEYFVSKDAMNIEGFGPSSVEALMKEGYIKDVADIYYLKNYREELIEKGIIGKEKSVDNLISTIERSKENDIDRLITGLGIRNVGKQSAKILAANFSSIKDIADATYDNLIILKDFGDTMVKDIINYFKGEKFNSVISRLEESGVNTISKISYNKKNNRLEGKTFVITGTLPTLKRSEASEIIQNCGGKVSSSVSKKTSYVLAGKEAGSKLDKAQNLGITIIDEEEFMDMIK